MRYNDPIKYNNQYIGYSGDVLDQEVQYLDYSNFSSVQYSTFSSQDSQSTISTQDIFSGSEGEIYFDQSSSDSESQVSINY